MCGGNLESSSGFGTPTRLMSSGAFRARTRVSEIHSGLGENPVTLAHNDESSSATCRQWRHTCVASNQPIVGTPNEARSPRMRNRKIRARSSGGRVEIGAIALRRESRDWTSRLAATISLSIAETEAVRDAGVCVMVRNWLCPDWRRVNMSESVDVCPSLDEEKVEHQPNMGHQYRACPNLSRGKRRVTSLSVVVVGHVVGAIWT